jgi:tryptophan synthase alpha subunit
VRAALLRAALNLPFASAPCCRACPRRRGRRLHRADLPLDESSEPRARSRRGTALVQMVTPVTELERLRQLCAGSQGFVCTR